MERTDLGILLALDALLQEASVTGAARRMGLSTPAMSHALRRVRAQLGDPVLVRSGRGMILTPHAESIRAEVHAVVSEATRLLEAPRPLEPREIERSFSVRATDYVLGLLGDGIDRALSERSPSVSLRFAPNAKDDAVALRDGGADLAVGIYGDLPQEMRIRRLLTDRFVCVTRKAHPGIGKRLTLRQYVNIPHIQIAPRGAPGGYIDDLLAERGHERRVARAVPYFFTALRLAARTDYLLTVSERLVNQFAKGLGLDVHQLPIAARPYALSLVWHPRFDGDPAHRYLREVFVEIAEREAGDRHPEARTKLDPSDPTSGQGRRRRRARR